MTGRVVGERRRAGNSTQPSIDFNTQDAIKTLRELVLVSEDTEYDCHLQFDHTYVGSGPNESILP